jgi:hypothetical protein
VGQSRRSEELRHRRAENLAAEIREANATKTLTRLTPAPSRITRWIEQAKNLSPMISH